MNLFVTVVGVLAVSSLGSSAGVPLSNDGLEERIEKAASVLFDGADQGQDFFTEGKDDLSVEQKIQAMGIDPTTIHYSILEDAKLLVVSI